MSNRERMLQRMRELCEELSPEDGIDPKLEKRRRAASARKESPRKTRQLCGQVARTLNLALGSCNDPVLQQLMVQAVEPAPDASRLRVWVTCDSLADIDPGEAQSRLGAAAGWLRSQVAASIHRKKAPVLLFGWSEP
jgi:ribosome-binding factor A